MDEQLHVSETVPLEGAFSKYLRTYRLLNSLLLALFFLVITFSVIWNIMMGIPLSDDAGSDFADAGQPSTAPKKQEQSQIDAKTKAGKTIETFTFQAGNF